MKTSKPPFVRFLRTGAAAVAVATAMMSAAQSPPPPGPNGAAPIPRMQGPPGGDGPANTPHPAPNPNQQPPPKPPANAGQPQPPSLPKSFTLPTEFRSYDGSGNNVVNLNLGAPNQTFIRLVPNDYADGAGDPAGADRPSARAVSNAVATQPANAKPNRRGASDMLWQWGQFLDHDLDETPTADPAESFPILVPTGDPYFDPDSTGTQVIGLNRSAQRSVGGIREQISDITAWIDASQVYGSSEARATALRALDGTGRLKVSTSNHGDLLPFNTDDIFNVPPGPDFFVAGDVRVNEQVGLIVIQTLFLREHNFWADLYRAANPEAGDEEIYQFARMIVGAEMQAITYREYLPIVLGGGAIKPYRGYKPEVDPTIANEFATAAYRFGHSMVSSTLLRLDAQGREIEAGNLTLAESFFQPQAVVDEGIDVVLRGMALQRAQELDEWVVDDLRNFLFGPPGAGGLDLASLNIQRGRDHGLPSFATMRAALKLRPVRTFQDINRNRTVVQELSSVYASPADVDLWVGGLSEADKAGAMVGEVFYRIMVDQFTRLRDGDRFWYQRYLPPELVRMVERQTLTTVIRRNTGIGREIPNNAFLAPARPPVGAMASPGKLPAPNNGTQAPNQENGGNPPPPPAGRAQTPR